MIECIYCQTIVSEVGSLISYYWRLFTNIDFMAGQPFGFWTLISFFTILSGLALLFLTFLIYRADPKNPKNRFITMMLLTESFRCLTVSIFWAYPYELEQIQSLYFIRILFYTTGIMLFFLYLSAPFFYIESRFSEWVVKSYNYRAQIFIPIVSFLILLIASNSMGGFHESLGEILWIYCEGVGEGVGGTASGDPLTYVPHCDESLSPLYPMMFSTNLLGPLATIIFFIPLIAAIITTLVITFTTKEVFKSGSTSQKNEIWAIRLGFIGKTSFQFLSIIALVTFFSLLPVASGPELTWFNNDVYGYENIPTWGILIGIIIPLISVNLVFAALFEGIVFSYAVMKHEVLGIDEKLRKTFTTALFAGLGAILFLVATELMENAAGVGWLGGVIIGIPFIILRKPILAAFSKISISVLPEAHTGNEEAYLEAFSIAMDDGIVTKDERKMLNIQAKTLGLDESRINHLETYYLSKQEEE